MRKNQCKLDGLPLPLTLSRKSNLRGLDEANPYRIGEQIKQNKLSTSRRQSGLAQMKQQLLQIKDDMFKLFVPPMNDPLVTEDVPDILCNTLKQQLNDQKTVQQKLRKLMQKDKLQYLATIDKMRKEKEQKSQELKYEKQKMSNKYKKIISQKDLQILHLRQDQTKERENHKNQMQAQKSKYDSLLIELANFQNIVKELQLGNSDSLIQGVELKKINIQLSTKLQATNSQLQNYKSLNYDLQSQIKQWQVRCFQANKSIDVLQSSQISLLERLQKAEQQLQFHIQSSSQQMNAQRMQIINFELTNSDLQEQNYILTQHNKFIKNILCQTQEYVKALEQEMQNYAQFSKNQKKHV